MALFLKECKKILCSITFILVVVTLIFFASVQEVFTFNARPITEPQLNQSYGTTAKEVPEQIMPAAVNSLYIEYLSNNYLAYPVGFYKNIKLSDSNQDKVAKVLSEITDKDEDFFKNGYKEAKTAREENDSNGNTIEIGGGEGLVENEKGELVIPDIVQETKPDSTDAPFNLKEGLGYENFKAKMKVVDALIGGGSQYSQTYIVNNFGMVPVTYEEAIQSYDLINEKDHFTGAYARLFTDYICLMASLLPVFLAVAIGLKDRRAKMRDLVDSRSVSSISLVATRYLAIVVMMIVPILILAFISNVMVWGVHSGQDLDYFAFITYTIGWVLPSVMISSAVGVFLTELTDTPIAIAVQALWWFMDMNIGIKIIKGGYGTLLNPRHNIKGNTQVYIDNFDALLINRVSYVVASLILIALTVMIYEQKRKGRLNGYDKIKTLFRNRKNKFTT